MDGITTRQFCLLTDFERVRRFMLEIYSRDWANGVPAPFLEYALCSEWMRLDYTHRFRLWLDGDSVAAFVFTENPPEDIYFSLRPGYETLADEMIEYARKFMPYPGSKRNFMLFKAQRALSEAAARAGLRHVGGSLDMQYDFSVPLVHALPEGFHFVDNADIDPDRVALCCYKGFNHEEEDGPWDGDAENTYKLLTAPNATPQYAVAIANEAGDYVCWAGMWWTPENSLAYMEPLCTVPEYRGRGLAAAALSELYRRMKPLGVTHMTGGSDKFYAGIGYEVAVEWCKWAEPSDEA